MNSESESEGEGEGESESGIIKLIVRDRFKLGHDWRRTAAHGLALGAPSYTRQDFLNYGTFLRRPSLALPLPRLVPGALQRGERCALRRHYGVPRFVRGAQPLAI